METWQIVVLVIVIVVLLAALVGFVVSRKQSAMRRKFGPEYDRAVARLGDRKAAEQELRDRARRREQLQLRPLDAATRERYRTEWLAIQRDFVDRPEASISTADALLDRVMRERGYPVDDFEEKAALVSVDHPQVVQDYRAARAVRDRNTNHLASTDELRQALLRYRSLFDELLGGPTSAGAEDRNRSDRR